MALRAALGVDLKNIRRYLKPAKADKSALLGSLAVSASAIVGALRMAIDCTGHLAPMGTAIGFVLASVAIVTGSNAVRKYLDALTIKDDGLMQAQKDADTLIDWQSDAQAEVDRAGSGLVPPAPRRP